VLLPAPSFRRSCDRHAPAHPIRYHDTRCRGSEPTHSQRFFILSSLLIFNVCVFSGFLKLVVNITLLLKVSTPKNTLSNMGSYLISTNIYIQGHISPSSPPLLYYISSLV
jgi:hypothetical protein